MSLLYICHKGMIIAGEFDNIPAVVLALFLTVNPQSQVLAFVPSSTSSPLAGALLLRITRFVNQTISLPFETTATDFIRHSGELCAHY